MNRYCNPDDIRKIKENKNAFIHNMIALNIPYDVCALMSAKMNEAIKQLEKEDRKDKCIHPDCECLDYCEADDPYSKTPIEKATPKNGL